MPGKSSLASDMKSLENFDLVKTVGTGKSQDNLKTFVLFEKY